jgi:tetratricopeptide (TPR) repeat protein
MTKPVYWGKGGEYGPYSVQEDGWPNAGEVMRAYRLKRGWSAAEVARQYSEALKSLSKCKKEGTPVKPVSATWILNMENENRVPTDITRRRLLADLLQIPPILFGLGSFEQALFKPKAETSALPKGPTILNQNLSPDLPRYEREIRAFWLLNETSHAHGVLRDIVAAIKELEALEEQTSGDLQRHVRELLYSHYRLASRITRDVLELPAAYTYANHAVRVTKSLGRKDLIAAALYARGFVRLTRGIFGEKAAIGMIEPNREKLTEALSDFEQALPLARPQLKGLLLLEVSRVQGLLRGSATDITKALSTMELVGKLIGSERGNEDSYTRILLDGVVKGLSEEEYLLGSAITFNAVGRPDKALEVFEDLEELDERKRRGKDHTRHHAWVEIVQAQAYLGTKQYNVATVNAARAFLVLRDIDSVGHIANIRAIYNDLLKSPYCGHKEVKELGEMLTDYYQSRGRK